MGPRGERKPRPAPPAPASGSWIPTFQATRELFRPAEAAPLELDTPRGALAHSGQYVAPDHARSASSRFCLESVGVGPGQCFQPAARSSSIAKKRATSGASKTCIGDPRKQRSHHAKCLVLVTGTNTRYILNMQSAFGKSLPCGGDQPRFRLSWVS
jgi:hypothetical protein